MRQKVKSQNDMATKSLFLTLDRRVGLDTISNRMYDAPMREIMVAKVRAIQMMAVIWICVMFVGVELAGRLVGIISVFDLKETGVLP